MSTVSDSNGMDKSPGKAISHAVSEIVRLNIFRYDAQLGLLGKDVLKVATQREQALDAIRFHEETISSILDRAFEYLPDTKSTGNPAP